MKGPDIHEAVAAAQPPQPPKISRKRDREPREGRPNNAQQQATSDARNAEALRRCRERAALDPVSDMARNHRAHAIMKRRGTQTDVPMLSDPSINFMHRLVVYRLLDMVNGFGDGEDGLNEEGAMILADAYPFMPTNEEERRELWALLNAPPPETPLFWRWAQAFKNHISRQVTRRVAEQTVEEVAA